MTKTVLISIIVVLLLGGSLAYFLGNCQDDWCMVFEWQKINAADSFDSCAALGFPVMESNPRQCKAGDKTFVETISNDMIRVSTPQPNSVVTSPLTIKGEARGGWYFEASFPVKILDANGKVVAQHYAQAQGEWMTNNFVPFVSVVPFEAPATQTGMLVLEKDNPSGLPQNDAAIYIPIRFR